MPRPLLGAGCVDLSSPVAAGAPDAAAADIATAPATTGLLVDDFAEGSLATERISPTSADTTEYVVDDVSLVP